MCNGNSPSIVKRIHEIYPSNIQAIFLIICINNYQLLSAYIHNLTINSTHDYFMLPVIQAFNINIVRH